MKYGARTESVYAVRRVLAAQLCLGSRLALMPPYRERQRRQMFMFVREPIFSSSEVWHHFFREERKALPVLLECHQRQRPE